MCEKVFDQIYFLLSDYYNHAMGGLVLEAIVHGLPTPKVKFYKDGHLLHARKNKVEFFLGTSFLEDREIFQCLLVRPDASVSGTYTIMAENKAGKKRYNHQVDFVTKYPLIHLPGMRHADKKLEDFVEEMLEKIPKQPEPAAAVEEVAPELAPAEVAPTATENQPNEENQAKAEIPETPKPAEIAEALQAVVEGEAPKAVEEAPKEKPKKHKSKSKHRSKKASSPKIDSDLVDDGEDEPLAAEEPEPAPTKRKFSTVVHEPYEEDTPFRIFNSKNKLWFSGNLRDQTVVEGSTIKMVCAVSGPLPIMKWFKNGKPVPWSATIRNNTGDGLGQVIIEKITRTDAGVYTCVAKNPGNEVETAAVIKVIQKSTVPNTDTSKPAFTRVLAEMYRTTEDDLVLEAHVRSVPEPKVVWMRDGIELNLATDSRYDFSNDHDGGYFFRIHKPSSADKGLYACEATNEVGKAKVTHKVNFTELERHTHPQFVYHKESFWQPTLRMSIEPEPVKEASVAPENTRAISQAPLAELKIAAVQESGTGGGQEANSAGEVPEGGSGGDENDDGEEGKDIEGGETQEETEGEEKAEKQEKQEKRPKSSRRKRYEGPVEPLLIRDSVRN